MTSRSSQERVAASPDDELEASRAPFMAHLQELRWRLWRAILAVLIAAVGCFFFHRQLYALLTEPLYASLDRLELESIMKFRTVQGAFMFHFKVALFGGLFLGIPVVLYQLWQFVAPGLYRHERRMVIPFVVMSTVCFAGGAVFAYTLVLPYTFDFLIGYAISDGPRQMLPDLTVEDYLGFTLKFLLAFAVVFELPVAIGFFASVGVITHRALIRFWRWAIVLSFVVAAILTPPDYISQLMLAVPLTLLYGVSIGIAWFITVRRERGQAGDTPTPPEALDPPEGNVDGERGA